MPAARFPLSLVPFGILAAITLAPEVGRADDAAVDFAKDVKPLLEAKCTGCHGLDKQEGGLRLDHRIPAMQGGDSGKIFVAGKPAESEIVKRIGSDDEFVRMPPPDSGVKPLTDAEVDVVRRWIESGAKWPDDGTPYRVKSDHWAFQPIVRPELPAVKNEAWIRNEIDRFVLARLEERGIEPSPEASRYTLIKRLYYDLIGLPPSPEEVDRFVNDDSPTAYEELVDRLLVSEHFGERWGRHWLDKARYADSDGYEKDRPRPNAWRYRDWVIDAVNADMPFDRFTIEQLAGDLLPDPTPMQTLATAFHRQTLTNTEGGTDKEQFRVEAVFDRVNTTGTVWLGLTVGCAQCHSHKYDPLSQTDYYQLFAFFDNGDEVNARVPISDAAVERYEREKKVFDAKLAERHAELERVKAEHADGFDAWQARIRKELAVAAANPLKKTPFEIVDVTSQNGATFEPQKDGSFLVTGTNPDRDTYDLELKTSDTQLAGLRLDVLPHESLGANGPGRTPHGNFVLSRIRVFSRPASGDGEEAEHAPAGAKADFSQDGWDVSGALKDAGKTGWAISPQFGKSHWAEFTFAEPIADAERRVFRVELVQEYGSRHTIGRFKISATSGVPGPQLPAEIAKLFAKEPETLSPQETKQLREHYFTTVPEVKQVADAVAEFAEENAPQSPYMQVRVIGQRTDNPRTTHVLRRGDFLQPMDPVEPLTPAVLHGLDAAAEKERATRLDLARWLMDEDNPLTPRVAVNHVWSYLFGEGLVRTMNDFGTRGDEPTHPELLDWLATEYPRLGWSRKGLIKTIVMSATYRQSSRHRPELAEIDATNQLLARQNRFRVEAEIVRDLYLAASGLLSRKVGGPSVFPPMPPDVAALSYANNFKWKTSEGGDRYRRGMYTFFKRTAPHPNLVSFDCPDANTTSVDRRTSNTPLQALVLLNNEVYVEAAQALAKRVLESDAATDDERLSLAFRLCATRVPDAEELSAFRQLLEESRQYYDAHPTDAEQLAGRHRAEGVPAPENAAWVATARIVMNTDEFVTRE